MRPQTHSENPYVQNTWIHDFGKFKLVLDEADKDFSRQIKMTGKYNYETLESTIFEKYLKNSMTVLDLGANIGYYTMFAASIVGPLGKVFAFEPSPNNLNLIRASVQVNSFHNVVVVDGAVSDQVGISSFYLSPYYISEHSLFDYHYSSGLYTSQNKIDVNVLTIDHYVEKQVISKVDFIKMDIEGSESKALNGMKKTLDENKNLILITEFWPRGFANDKKNPRDFLETLQQFEFKIHHIDELEQKVYPVSVSEMMNIADLRTKNWTEKNKEIQSGGWYTNLLCIKSGMPLS